MLTQIFRFFAFAVAVGSATSIDKPALRADEFRWQLSGGDRYHVILIQKSNVSTAYETRTSDTTTETTLELNWEVKSVIDDIATIEQTIERVGLTMGVPTKDGSGIVQVDTRDLANARGAKEELVQQLRSLLGLTFTVKMAGDGSIQAVDVPEPTLQALRAAPSSMTFRQMLTPDGLLQLYGQTTFALPKEAIQPNFRWSTKSSSASPWGTLNIETNYTYLGEGKLEGQAAAQFNIERKVNVDPSSDSPANKQKTAESNRLKSQSGSGSYFFDSSAGHFLGGNFEQRIEASRTYREANLETVYLNSLSLRFAKRSGKRP